MSMSEDNGSRLSRMKYKVQQCACETCPHEDVGSQEGSSMLCGVIEVCYSSMVMELHKGFNYSQVHHFYGFPGNLSGVVFAIEASFSICLCCDFLKITCRQHDEAVFLISSCFFLFAGVFLIFCALSSLSLCHRRSARKIPITNI